MNTNMKIDNDADVSEITWGVPASQAIAELNAGKITKWDRETAWWRLHDHALALARGGCSREDALEYLRSYNREGSEIPQWFNNLRGYAAHAVGRKHGPTRDGLLDESPGISSTVTPIVDGEPR